MDPTIKKKIETFMLDIGEHFESARFFGTFPEGDGETGGYTIGHGNYYAQEGQIREWLTQQDEETRQHSRLKTDDESG